MQKSNHSLLSAAAKLFGRQSPTAGSSISPVVNSTSIAPPSPCSVSPLQAQVSAQSLATPAPQYGSWPFQNSLQNANAQQSANVINAYQYKHAQQLAAINNQANQIGPQFGVTVSQFPNRMAGNQNFTAWQGPHHSRYVPAPLEDLCPYPNVIDRIRLCGFEVDQTGALGLVIAHRKPFHNYVSLPLDATEALWMGALDYLVTRRAERANEKAPKEGASSI